MNTSLRPHVARLACMLLLAVAPLPFAGCDSNEANTPPPPGPTPGPSFPSPETLTATLVPSDLLRDVVNENCQSFAEVDPTTLLFHVPLSDAVQGACSPMHELTAPGGQQLTAGDWIQAEGEVAISCMDGGTQYDFHFEGLIPGGVYTIWHFPATGGGALASHPGNIHNEFTAESSGAADFSVVGTAGAMTLFGTVAACNLPVPPRSAVGDLGGELFVLLYHKDNRSWGNSPGPEDQSAGHLVFMGR
ncbi:MAG: hypothetical protein HKN04_13640 [Rhodothermaceae bacterium]|nr:hypothetical protein [Rhodothermaceae bacterium]